MSSIFIFLARQVRKSLLFFSPLFRTEKFKVFSVKIISQTLILHVVIFIFFTFPKEWNCLFIAESTLALPLCHFLYCLSGAVPVLGFVCTGYFLFLYLCHLIMLRLLVRLIQSVSSYSIFGSGITQRDLIWEALTYMRLIGIYLLYPCFLSPGTTSAQPSISGHGSSAPLTPRPSWSLDLSEPTVTLLEILASLFQVLHLGNKCSQLSSTPIDIYARVFMKCHHFKECNFTNIY